MISNTLFPLIIFACMFDEVLIVVVSPCGLNVMLSSFTNVAVNVLVVVTVIVTRLNLITVMCASIKRII